MSEFVKKTALGYRPVPGSHSDPDCTHVILTKNEYDQLLQDKAKAEQEKRNMERESEKTIRLAKDNALRQVQSVQQEAQKQVEALECELESKIAEIAFQVSLNANLLRISKEQANADRKLKPKKEHSGYVVVLSTEKEYRYKDRNGYWKTVIIWETVLQSPYSVDFAEEQARKLILEEFLQKSESGSWLIQKIGITARYDAGYATMVSDVEWKGTHQQYNVMLERRLRRAFKIGYWEVAFTHTKPLGIVPKEMRARDI